MFLEETVKGIGVWFHSENRKLKKKYITSKRTRLDIVNLTKS